MGVFESMEAAYWVLAAIVCLGFLRLLWPRDRSQLPGTVLIVALIALIAVLSALD
jgi:hypothetical protein